MTETIPPESPSPAPQALPPVVSHNHGVFGSSLPTSIALIVVVLFFLLSFIDIKCNGMPVHNITGLELATGYSVKGLGNDNTLFGKLENSDLGNKGTVTNEKKDVNVFALVALAIGVLTAAISFRKGISPTILVSGGVLGFAAMVGLWIQITRQVKTDTAVMGAGPDNFISVTFTPWFYLAALGFLFAAFHSYKRGKLLTP